MAYIDSTYREQNGPDAGAQRQQSAALTAYFDNAWVPYTPVLTNAGVATTLGASTFTGAYKRIGSLCYVRGAYTLGTGVNWTAGAQIEMSLPFGGTPTGAAWALNGVWFGYHSGTIAQAQPHFTNANPQIKVFFQYANAAPTGAATSVTGANPWAWAIGDSWEANFYYEVAK
jgi:hypothetical protein